MFLIPDCRGRWNNQNIKKTPVQNRGFGPGHPEPYSSLGLEEHETTIFFFKSLSVAKHERATR